MTELPAPHAPSADLVAAVRAAVDRRFPETVRTLSDLVAVPGIAVAKSPSTTSVLGSAQVTYTYSVTNDGNEALRAVSLADDRCPNPVLQDANLTTGTGDVNLDGLLGVSLVMHSHIGVRLSSLPL